MMMSDVCRVHRA